MSAVRFRMVAGAGLVIAVVVLVAIRWSGGSSSARPSASSTTQAATNSPSAPIEDAKPTLTAAQLGGLKFHEVGQASGLTGRQSNELLLAEKGMTAGAAVADVDGDGDLDLFAGRIGAPDALFLNDGHGKFHDVTTEAGLGGRQRSGGSSAAAFADVDGDGDPDLYVGSLGTATGTLYLNDGSGHFRDATDERGLGVPDGHDPKAGEIHGVTFADYDHDGHLDLLVLQWDIAFFSGPAGVIPDPTAPGASNAATSPGCRGIAAIRAAGFPRAPGADANRSRLFHNDGTGHFTDATAAMGLRLDHVAGFGGQFVDIDGDGWEDLLIAGDFCTSRLYRNDRGKRFVDITETAGVGTDENAMGSVVRDIDGDGRPDWFVTAIDYPTGDHSCPADGSVGCTGNRLYLNRGGDKFEDVTDAYGVRHGWWGWGAAVEDFADDGRLEVMQTNGYQDRSPAESFDPDDPLRVYYHHFEHDPTRLWMPNKGSYVDVAAAAGLDDRGLGRALIPFDADGNGSLDVVVAEHAGSLRLYRNDRPADRGWLTIRLDDSTHPGNRLALGARVRVTVAAGAPPVTGWINDGGSYESQKPAEFHVGLGSAHRVARIEVWWPGATEPQTIDDAAADRVLTVRRAT